MCACVCVCLVCVCVRSVCMCNTGVVTPMHAIDEFHSIFLLWQLEGKGSCDVDVDQSAGSMMM